MPNAPCPNPQPYILRIVIVCKLNEESIDFWTISLKVKRQKRQLFRGF